MRRTQTLIQAAWNVIACFGFLGNAAFAETPFTYQGRLDSNGAPYNGTITVKISVWPAQVLFSPVRTEIVSNVTVNNGLFTVTPTTFVPGDFVSSFGDWIEIEVSTDGGSTYTKLSPRQRVTYTPLAMNAERAKSLTGTITAAQITGSLPTSQLSGTLNPSILTSGSTTGTITFSPASGAPFVVPNAASPVVTNLNADKLDGFDSAAFLRTIGGTLTGSLSLANPAALDFASTTRQMISLFGSGQYGIGVQSSTLYQRTGSDFSWFSGGVHSDTRNAPGSGGVENMRLLSDSTLWLRPGNSAAPRARLFFGDVSGALPFAAIGEASDEDDVVEITGKAIRIRSNNNGNKPMLNFGATTGQFIELFKNASDTYGIGVQSGTEYFRSGDNFAWFKDGVHDDAGFNPGAGGTTMMTLNSTGDLFVAGALSTTVLTIRGGADVAEPFDMSGPDEMEPGCVVVIDDENPGKLKLSSEANDTRVAGIVSGAGGVKPGLRLHQDGVMEGDHHVALSGRVYVKAEATHGAIRPGDLLTTSDKPGYAMKVARPGASQGAIIGKAMSNLDKDTGLVLVLVTLQ